MLSMSMLRLNALLKLRFPSGWCCNTRQHLKQKSSFVCQQINFQTTLTWTDEKGCRDNGKSAKKACFFKKNTLNKQLCNITQFIVNGLQSMLNHAWSFNSNSYSSSVGSHLRQHGGKWKWLSVWLDHSCTHLVMEFQFPQLSEIR